MEPAVLTALECLEKRAARLRRRLHRRQVTYLRETLFLERVSTARALVEHVRALNAIPVYTHADTLARDAARLELERIICDRITAAIDSLEKPKV